MSTLKVDGKHYEIVERMNQGGLQVCIVSTPEGNRVAVKCGGVWRWWTVEDRIGAGLPQEDTGATT